MYSSVYLTQIAFVYAKWYTREETEGNVDTTKESNVISARSPIECTLKCQRKLMKSFYVQEREQCYCKKNWDNEATGNGVMFEQHDVCILVKIFFLSLLLSFFDMLKFSF